MRNYNEQEKEIVSKMLSIGLNISCKGFNYILDAVKTIHDTDDDVKTTHLYTKIANTNNSTYSKVERCIRSEIDRFYNTSTNIPSILATDINGNKLANGEFLYRLTYWLYK